MDEDFRELINGLLIEEKSKTTRATDLLRRLEGQHRKTSREHLPWSLVLLARTLFTGAKNPGHEWLAEEAEPLFDEALALYAELDQEGGLKAQDLLRWAEVLVERRRDAERALSLLERIQSEGHLRSLTSVEHAYILHRISVASALAHGLLGQRDDVLRECHWALTRWTAFWRIAGPRIHKLRTALKEVGIESGEAREILRQREMERWESVKGASDEADKARERLRALFEEMLEDL